MEADALASSKADRIVPSFSESMLGNPVGVAARRTAAGDSASFSESMLGNPVGVAARRTAAGDSALSASIGSTLDDGDDSSVLRVLSLAAILPEDLLPVVEAYAAPYFGVLLNRLGSLLPPSTHLRFKSLHALVGAYALRVSKAPGIGVCFTTGPFETEISLVVPTTLKMTSVQVVYVMPSTVRRVRLIVKRQTTKKSSVLEHVATPLGAIVPRFRILPLVVTLVDSVIEL
jgi:hypothetical protein